MVKNKYMYMMLVPAVIIFIIFGVYPALEAIWISLNSYNLSDPAAGKDFIFFKNYLEIFKTSRFWLALIRSMWFVIVSVLSSFIFGLGIALILHKVNKLKNFFRIIFLVPMIIAPTVSALNFKFMYNYSFGIFNFILELLRIGRIDFLGSPSVVMWSVIIIDVWQWTPLVILIILAGLEALPKEPFEAALIDRANNWQMFRYITLPLLNKFVIIALVIRIMDAFRVYETIYLMTAGGPGTATETLNLYLATVGFSWFDMGQASAMGIITLYFTLFLIFFLVKKTGAFSRK